MRPGGAAGGAGPGSETGPASYRFPPLPLLGGIFWQAFLLWILLRILLAVGLVWGEAHPLELAPVAQVLVPGVVAAAAYLQLSRRGELLLLRTLGIGPAGVVVPALLLAGVAEILLAVLVS